MAASPSAAFVHKTLPNYKSEKWLQKYGWERGTGLGKDQQGRLDFVKVSKKDNTKGLGVPSYQVKDFTWWDDVYTKAAQSVKLGSDGEFVEIVAEERRVETGKSVYSGLFVTGGTMEDERKDEKRRGKVRSEAELFDMCGGSDGRKFKQEGKHARLRDHDTSMKSHTDEHNKKRVDAIYKDLTDAEKKMLDKASRKKEKKEREKKKEANKKSAERKKKRKRETAESDSESEVDTPKHNKDKDKDLEDEKPKKKKSKSKE